MPTRRTLFQTCAATLLAGLGARVCANTPGVDTAAPAALGELPGAQRLGASRMRFFGFDIYDAALWVAPGFRASRYAQHALALELTYLRSLSGNAIAERSIQEMRRAADISAAQEQRWLTAMREAFPDVNKGDRITGLHQPGVGARFWFNGQLRGAVADPEFSRLFFGIWLAETTSEPTLRSALLAGAAS